MYKRDLGSGWSSGPLCSGSVSSHQKLLGTPISATAKKKKIFIKNHEDCIGGDPRTQGQEQKDQEFKACLGYIMSYTGLFNV